MVDTLGAEARPKNLVSRIVGVVTTPRSTYADVAAHPRWFGIFAIVVIVSAASVGLFMWTQVGREALLDQQVRTLESIGRTLSDAQYQQMEARLPLIAMMAAASQAIVLPVIGLLIAAVAMAVFNLMGGDGTLRQTFAIVAHSGVLIALQHIFVLPLDYARQSLSSPTTLAVFFPFLEDDTFIGRLLGSVDLFMVWWIVSAAIGFGVLYRRRTAPIATTMLLLYVAIGVVIAGIKTAFSGA